MKKVIALTFGLALAPFFANAATLIFPSEEPVASVTIPDDWDPKETVSGIEAKSPDTAIYFSIDVATARNMETVIEDAIRFLTDNGVTIDEDSQRDSGDVEINGMTFGSLEFDGEDADGPVEVSLGFAAPSDGKMLVVTYWGTKATQGVHTNTIAKILGSMKPSK